jgi:hypothetical protein
MTEINFRSLAVLAASALCLLASTFIAPECRAEETGKMDLPKQVSGFRAVLKSKDVQVFSRAALELRKWMIANDPHRPTYHFTGPESWINDPNGPFYYKGKYHLFYQFAPIIDGNRSPVCWGHAGSTDLVHWTDWPVAIWPDSQYDRNGAVEGLNNKAKVVSHRCYGFRTAKTFITALYHVLGELPEPPMVHKFL